MEPAYFGKKEQTAQTTVSSSGGDVSLDQGRIYKTDQGTIIAEPTVAGDIVTRNVYHLDINVKDWIWLGLLFFLALVLVYAIFHLVFQFTVTVSFTLAFSSASFASLLYGAGFYVEQRRAFHQYRSSLIAELQELLILRSKVSLERAFVSLRIAEEFQSIPRNQREAWLRRQQKESRYETAIEIDEAIFRYPALLILGEPGAGKTTLLKYLAIQFANDKEYLPLFIPLYEYIDALNQKKQVHHYLSLVDYLPEALRQRGFTNSKRFVQRKLRRGGVILLLDALDEIPDDNARAEAIQAINQFLRGYGHNRVVVASRIAPYRATQGTLMCQHTEVLEFLPEQMDQFVRALLPIPEANRLIHLFRIRPGLRNVGRNPLLLSVVTTVFKDRGTLPERPAELYQECMVLLLEEWERAKPITRVDFERVPLYERLHRLENIAFHFHQQGGDIHITELTEQIQMQFNLPNRREAQLFLEEIVRYSGILRQQTIQTMAFWHLSFQEYLAAGYLHRQIQQVGLQTLDPYVVDSRWEESLIFLISLQNRNTDLITFLYRHEKALPTLRERLLLDLAKQVTEELDEDNYSTVQALIDKLALLPIPLHFIKQTPDIEASLALIGQISWLLASNDTEEIGQALLETVSETDNWLRQWLIVEAVQKLGAAEASFILYRTCPNFNHDVRAHTISTVKRFLGNRDAIDFLYQQMLREEDMTILSLIVEALFVIDEDLHWVLQLEHDATQQQLKAIGRILREIPSISYAQLQRLQQATSSGIIDQACRDAMEKTYAFTNTDTESEDRGEVETLESAWKTTVSSGDWIEQVQILGDLARRSSGATTTLLKTIATSSDASWLVRQAAVKLLVQKGLELHPDSVQKTKIPSYIIDNTSLANLRRSLSMFEPWLRDGIFTEENTGSEQIEHPLYDIESIEYLVAIVNDDSQTARTRWQAMTLLGERGSQDAVIPISNILNQRGVDSELKRRAALALGLLGREAVIAPLKTCLLSESRWDVKTACARALSEMGITASLEALISALLEVPPEDQIDIRVAMRYVKEPLDDVVSPELLIAIGQVVREDDKLDKDLYRLMTLLYDAVVKKVGLG